MAILNLNLQMKQKNMPKCSMLKCMHNICPGRIDMIIYGIYQCINKKAVSGKICMVTH